MKTLKVSTNILGSFTDSTDAGKSNLSLTEHFTNGVVTGLRAPLDAAISFIKKAPTTIFTVAAGMGIAATLAGSGTPLAVMGWGIYGSFVMATSNLIASEIKDELGFKSPDKSDELTGAEKIARMAGVGTGMAASIGATIATAPTLRLWANLPA